jgi:uncharacterized membrane protein SpoIIM required for sporulation
MIDVMDDGSSAEARFASLLDRVEGVGRLDVDEVHELARLYRLHLARLARERERAVDPDRLRLLNALCVRAHTVLHVPPAGARRGLVRAVRAAVAGSWPTVAAAAGLLAIGFLVGAGLGLRDADAVHALVPASLGYDPGTLDALISSAAARQAFFAHTAVPAAHNATFGAGLFANNTRVGLLAFATGMLAGVPTVVLTVYNGLLLGAFASIFLRDLVPIGFLAWILPHGIPELTAIVLCGAGGLALGGAVAVPGRAGRRAAIRAAATQAFALAALALPLLALAALTESFVRESSLSTVTRFAVAALQLGFVTILLRWTRAPAATEPSGLGWLRALQRGTARSSR